MKGYGNHVVLSRYAGTSVSLPPTASWQHGWIPSFAPTASPEMIVGEDGRSRFEKDRPHFVARKDHVEALNEWGYSSVRAIGLPITYAMASREGPRNAGSLVAVPHHSGPKQIWDPKAHEAFADYVADHRHDFSEVSILIHGWDWLHGVQDIYKRRGLTTLQGARRSDASSLTRMARLFCTHETVVSNDLGSSIAYAAYLGARVAVAGEPPAFPYEGALDTSYYRNSIESLVSSIRWFSDWRRHPQVQFLLRNPVKAECAIEWGRFEVGERWRLSASEVADLFGAAEEGPSPVATRFHSLAKLPLKAASALVTESRMRLAGVTPDGVKAQLRQASAVAQLSNGMQFWRNMSREILALVAGKPEVVVSTTSAPKSVIVRRDPSSITTAIDVFALGKFDSLQRHIEEAGLILDVGAYLGYSTLRLRQINPSAEIIAIEPRRDHFETLRQNVRGLDRIHLIHGALWPDAETVEVAESGRVGGGTTALRHLWRSDAPLHEAPGIRWDDLVAAFKPHGRHTIIFLDVEGSEGCILEAAGTSIVASCRTCVISLRTGDSGVSELVARSLVRIYSSVPFELVDIDDFLVATRTS